MFTFLLRSITEFMMFIFNVIEYFTIDMLDVSYILHVQPFDMVDQYSDLYSDTDWYTENTSLCIKSEKKEKIEEELSSEYSSINENDSYEYASESEY